MSVKKSKTPNPLRDLILPPEVEEIIEARAEEITERGGNGERFKKDVAASLIHIIEWPESAHFMGNASPYRRVITKEYQSTLIYKIDPASWVGYVVDFFLRGEEVHPPED